MNRPILAILALAGFMAVVASPVHANVDMTVHLSLHYGGSFDSSMAPIPSVVFDHSIQVVDPTWIHRFDVKMSLSGPEPDEDFASATFFLALGPGLTGVDLGAGKWNPSGGVFDSNGASPGGLQNHWQNGNADAGGNPNDLLDITVQASSSEAQNRQYGEGNPSAGFADLLGYPTYLGSIYLKWDGITTTQLYADFSNGFPWATYLNNSTGEGTFTAQPYHTTLPSGAFFLGSEGVFLGGDGGSLFVPEPSGLILLSAGGLTLLRRRR